MWDDSILVAGAGAVGLVCGGMLHAAGHRVAMLGRTRHLDAIHRNGLRIEGLFGSHRMHGIELFSEPNQLRGRRFSLIIVAVKSYDTAALAPLLQSWLSADGLVIAAQNGLGNLEVLARHLDPGRLLGARVIFGAELTAPAEVRVTVIAEPVAIGPDPVLSGAAAIGLGALAQQIAPRFSSSGIPAQAVADIRPLLWTKLFYNAALNPLGALLKTNYGSLGADPGLRQIMNAVIGEAFAVARGLRVELPFATAEDYLAVFYDRLLPVTLDHRPSMLVDLERRGRTEIDALNGRVVALADTLGWEAVTNRTLTRLIKAAERLRQGAAEEQK